MPETSHQSRLGEKSAGRRLVGERTVCQETAQVAWSIYIKLESRNIQHNRRESRVTSRPEVRLKAVGTELIRYRAGGAYQECVGAANLGGHQCDCRLPG